MKLSDYVTIVVTVPETHADLVREALGHAGAGKIGDYSHCSYSSKGIGRFMPTKGAHPYLGKKGLLEEVIEERIETKCSRTILNAVLREIKKAHPYEEPVINIYPIYEIGIKEPIKVYKSKPKNFLPKLYIVAVYVSVKKKLLLLEIGKHKSEANCWTVPAGKLEAKETPVEGAKRELFEETGISSTKPISSLGKLYMHRPEMDYIYHAFTLTCDKQPKVKLSHEHQSYQWATRSQAEKLKLMDGAQQALDFFYERSKLW